MMPFSAYIEMFIKNRIPKSSSDLHPFFVYSIFMMFLNPYKQMLN